MSNQADGQGSVDPTVQHLVDLVVALKEEQCMASMRQLLDAGVAPMTILDGCIEGVRRVGELFESGEYFIAALIMAGEIMRQATELLRPHLAASRSPGVVGTILLGTVKGDIHNLGKDLFALLLQANGFDVVDLGVDVAPERFLAKARDIQPDIIGLSCVLTFGIEQLQATVQLLHNQLPPPCPPVIIGGACIDKQIREVVQADRAATDAAEGLRICQELLKKELPTTP